MPSFPFVLALVDKLPRHPFLEFAESTRAGTAGRASPATSPPGQPNRLIRGLVSISTSHRMNMQFEAFFTWWGKIWILQCRYSPYSNSVSRIQPFFAIPDPTFYFLMDPGPGSTEKVQELSVTLAGTSLVLVVALYWRTVWSRICCSRS